MDPTIIILPALFALLAFVTWVVAGTWHHRRELRLRADFQTLLLHRIGSAKDVADFLSTPAGRELAQSLLTVAPPPVNTDRAIQALQIGIVFAAAGVGLLTIGLLVDFEDIAARHVFTALGGIALSLGIGYLIASAAVYRFAAVSKKTG